MSLMSIRTLSVTVLVLCLNGCGSDDSTIEHADVISVESVFQISQKKSQEGRQFAKSVRLLKRATLTDSSDAGMHGAVYLGVDGFIYTLDVPNSDVRRYNNRLMSVMGYSQGAGRGPGQLLNPIDMSLDDDMNLYIADSYNRKIEQYSPGGEYLYTISLDAQPYRIAISNNVLFMNAFDREYYFKKINLLNSDADGQSEVAGFGRHDPALPLLTPIMAGGELAVSSNKIVHAYNHFPAMVFYDIENSDIAVLPTMDAGNLSMTYEEVLDIDQAQSVRPPAQRFNGDISVHNDTIFVHTWEASTIDNMILDRYDSDGQYLDSIRIPESQAISFSVSGDTIAVTSMQAQTLSLYLMY